MAGFDVTELVPKALLTGFAGVGALYLGSKILSYIILLLDLFVLPGTNVRAVVSGPNAVD